MAARATHRLQLFPATSSPLVRHPLVLASLAHSLEEIAPGRTYLTVAPGFISTRSVGKPRATVAFMRAAIRDLRRLLAGEDVEFGPTSTRLRNRSATPTPVYLLAAGPRMIELAGEMADGVFLMVGLLEDAHDPAAIPEDQARQIADAFGLFGPPERCAERLLQAREDAGVEHVFLFPAHDLAGGYDMPEAEVQAFAEVIRPRLGA